MGVKKVVAAAIKKPFIKEESNLNFMLTNNEYES
jgi:hypothetical protein